LVHDVIEAITTAPWSSWYVVPSGAVTGVALRRASRSRPARRRRGSSPARLVDAVVLT
jgi:hypothetical protein